ncbi:tripartite tricarboxylate transporter TctB family protein [Demetria terragena]|uniref:tripartite tricarboxylate transporter TctB family protein n=1 Tax=Demetria terragena TaxID=63959 RepID=UPI0003703DE0|nr:tripartite tricarboxylate transporter TctB family protein [Demetria terragena]
MNNLATRTPEATRSGTVALAVPAVMAAFTIITAIGTARMEVPEETDFPGPTFVPWILVAAGALLTVLLAVAAVRHGDVVAKGNTYPTYTDWKAVSWAVGGFLAFGALLDILGWIIAAALLFWTVAHAFASKRPLFDVSVALLASSGIYLIFGVVLDVPLPAGILGGL